MDTLSFLSVFKLRYLQKISIPPLLALSFQIKLDVLVDKGSLEETFQYVLVFFHVCES